MGHPVVSAKSPDVEMLLMVRGTDWVLVRTTSLYMLVVWMAWFPNARLVAFKV
jgi:hypothetical protein